MVTARVQLAIRQNFCILHLPMIQLKMLQFNSSELVPIIVRIAISDIWQKAKAIVVLVVC
jgi:hypothetical protein